MSDNDPRQLESSGPHTKGVVRALRVHVGGAGSRTDLEMPPEVRDCLDILKNACGSNLVVVIFFGSRLLGTSPDSGTAADLFVVVENYHDFYHEVGYRLPAARRARVAAMLNRILPPNIIHLQDPGDLKTGAKCFVISTSDVAVALSRCSHDYFCRGRLVQRVHIVHARSAEDHEKMEQQLETARRATLDWVPIYLGETFSVQEYCSRMLEVSYAGEIRPETRERVQEVVDAQHSYFQLMYGRVLEEAVTAGKLRRTGEGYCLATQPTRGQRLRWRLFFAASKIRATLRWAKYILTFDDWLDYIARKAERRTGVRLKLSRAERRMPILFIWPKAIKVLRAMRSPVPASQPDDEDAVDQDRSPR